MKHVVQHSLSKADAKRAVEAAWANYSQRLAKYGPRLQWLNEDQGRVNFTVRGKDFEGGFRVAERSFELELDVPLLMRPFVKPAMAAIDREVAKWVQLIESQK